MSNRDKITETNFEITDNTNFRHTCMMGGCEKLSVYDWLKEIPESSTCTDIVEVRFKSTRKGFYKNVNALKLKQGDIIAVEASPGHDIGIVSLTGELVPIHLKKYNINPSSNDFKKIYRKAKEADIRKWKEAINDEQRLLVKSREIASRLNLNMKIGDVESQGDKTKAIFYYIADERVDFREMIKILAEELKIRIEMRQIGARQEAGRIGGTGPCGREMCCTTWLCNFTSVTTNSARIQDVSLNPQKLAGQCSKLKCCLNYELASYVDSQKDFPTINQPLETKDGFAYHKKTDILKRIMWFSYAADSMDNMIPLSIEKVKEIISLNKRGIKPDDLTDKTEKHVPEKPIDFQNVVGQESLTRFDKKKGGQHHSQFKKNNPNQRQNPNTNRPQQGNSNQAQPNQNRPQQRNPNQAQPNQNRPQQGNPNQTQPNQIRPQGNQQLNSNSNPNRNQNPNRNNQNQNKNQHPNKDNKEK